MNEKICHILKRFPEKSRLIDLLLKKDPEFVALCEDYDDCVNALRYWSGSNAPEADTRVNEYRVLVQELEEEIDQALEGLNLRRSD